MNCDTQQSWNEASCMWWMQSDSSFFFSWDGLAQYCWNVSRLFSQWEKSFSHWAMHNPISFSHLEDLQGTCNHLLKNYDFLWDVIFFIFTNVRSLNKGYISRSKHRGTPKLEFEVQRICGISQSTCPPPVIFMYGTIASASNFTCRPNINYLLYNIVGIAKMINMVLFHPLFWFAGSTVHGYSA